MVHVAAYIDSSIPVTRPCLPTRTMPHESVTYSNIAEVDEKASNDCSTLKALALPSTMSCTMYAHKNATTVWHHQTKILAFALTWSEHIS